MESRFFSFSYAHLKQGNKVRDLKSQGVSKQDLSPEIEKLLQLKHDLAVALGADPFALTKGSSKKKKK